MILNLHNREQVFICDPVLSKQQSQASFPSHQQLGFEHLLVIAYHWLPVEVTAVSGPPDLPTDARGHVWCHGGRR